MKVVILGKGEMLSNLIEGCLDAECDIVGVFRYESTVFSPFHLKLRDFFKSSSDVTLIKKYKLNELKCKSANSQEFKKEILKLNADLILTGTWKEKLSKEIIDLPTIASVNVHPSYLPKYRGPNPYLQTILNREHKSGLTFHLLNEEYDKGAILSQKEIKIYLNDTAKELKERTVFQARLMVAELVKKLEFGLVIPVQQNEDNATYYPNIKAEDKMLNFEKENAEQIHARIRAFHPWLPCYITISNNFITPNPYKLKIINEIQTNTIIEKNNIKNAKAGQIIDTNPRSLSITVLCNNKKSIKFSGVKLYGFFKKLFTKQFIKNFKI